MPLELRLSLQAEGDDRGMLHLSSLLDCADCAKDHAQVALAVEGLLDPEGPAADARLTLRAPGTDLAVNGAIDASGQFDSVVDLRTRSVSALFDRLQ